jgi:NADH-quinone oxidoreductase subunit L
MIPETAVWCIIAIPLAAAALIAFVIRPSQAPAWRISGIVAALAMASAFVLSVWALASALDADGAVGFAAHEWFTIGDAASGAGFRMEVGILLDPLSAIMLLVVSGVSFLVQVYSMGYMLKDGSTPRERYADYPRYFAYMSLFTAAMFGLVLSRNLIQLFAFWEIVGLASYLLIGFWHHRPAAAAAAKKAFIITRIGDFGFLLMLLYLFSNRSTFAAEGINPFDIAGIAQTAALLPTAVATWLALGIFAGAAGKSAQFPLHTWLPDAMEGPTPVSSLIHAATMVAAGVFLVARMFPLFEAGSGALDTVALVGAFTAVFAATMALVANDIKRVLAYSTISQLGYMMLALGMGAPAVALFHLFNHAFFKCLLFLGAGSVNHATGTFDMRYMGGLRKVMPITYVAMTLAALSLAGIFPLAGFWSKDEILSVAWSGREGTTLVSQLAFWLGVAAVFLTAFYAFRLIYLTFHGRFRGGVEAQPERERVGEEHQVHLHEAPWVMVAPMVVLAVLSVGSGFVVNATVDLGTVPAHWFSHFLLENTPSFNYAIAVSSSALALGGIALATAMYLTGHISPSRLTERFPWAHLMLSQRYFMDHIYEDLVVRRLLHRGLFRISDWLDRQIVDGFVDLVSWTGSNAGRAVAQLQTGQVQIYGVAITLGVIVMLMTYLAQR